MAYCTRTDLDRRWGSDNVDKWADIDDDGNAATISDAIDTAIEWADAYIDSRLYHGYYVLPISGTNASIIMRRVATAFAGHALYTNRGIDEEGDGVANKLTAARDEAEDILDKILRYEIKLDASRASTGPTVPVIIDAQEHFGGRREGHY